MTMLDRMRRHKGWLKWSLGIVVVTFVLLYVPAFFRDSGVGASGDVLATVNGREVTVGSYRRVYDQQIQSLRQNYAGAIDESMLRQFGIPQRVIQQLVEEQAVIAEAERLGIHVSDAELRERLLRLPSFQENGQFIGEARYRQILNMQRPPLVPSEFEEQLRGNLISEKLQAAISGWVHVSDSDVDAEYRKRNEKVKLDLAIFTANQFRAGIQVTDTDLAAQFAAHADTYKVPEKRRARYLSIDAEALKASMTVTAEEIEAKYKADSQVYSTPEQVRASHILFKTEGKDEAVVKKAAEDVLKKVKAGGDFAALAKQYSEDSSNTKGGDLDYFGKGTMAKEFEDATWALKVGQVSDLVKSQFGFHIIKLTDRKAASTRQLADVRAQIEDQIKFQKAKAEADRVSQDVAKQITKPADLDTVAKAHGWPVRDSGLFSREEPLAGLGFVPAVANEAFTMDQDKVSGALQTTGGYAFITVTEIKPSYVPKIEDVKDKVREDVIKQKALDLAKTKATSMATAAAKGNFAAAAKAAGGDVKSTDFVSRNSAYPEIGVNGAVDDAAFGMKTGETSAPISTDTAIVVVHVKERQEITAAALAAERDTLRDQFLQQHRQEFFAAYMGKARERLKVQFNENAIRQLIGG